MKIGVSGASGHLGKAVVSELLQRARGHDVVAITRTPEAVSGPAHGRFGDYDRPESLAEAYAGLDRLLIITTVAPEPGKRGTQNVAAIDAAVKAGVKHIVFMSAVGTRREEEPARGASYWRGEQHLVATAPAWTILRMNFYAEAFVQQAQASLGQGVLTGLAENRVAFVARGDVAAAAAGILIGDGHAGAIYNATGPERLSGAERGPDRRNHRSTACVPCHHGRATARRTDAGGSAGWGRQCGHGHPGELRDGCVRHCDQRRRAPWRPAAQASPRRAGWSAEISVSLTT
jgi:NAD(P)H dehydrogenase (quinone)